LFSRRAPSLTRGRICSFQLLLGLARAVFLWADSRETNDYILVSQLLKFSQSGGLGSCVRLLQEQEIPVILQALGLIIPFKAKVILRPTVSPLDYHGGRHPSAAHVKFFSFLKLFLDGYGFLDVERPL
jgi:hypothetical protein